MLLGTLDLVKARRPRRAAGWGGLAAALVVAVPQLAGPVPARRPLAPRPAAQACVPGAASSLSCSASGPDLPNPVALVGTTAPPLVGPNLNGSGDLDLRTVSHRPLAVVFWLNTCPHCRRDLPKLAAAAGQLRDVRVVTVAIHPTSTGPRGFETPRAAARTLHLTLPTILLNRTDLLTGSGPPHWQVVQTPTVFLINAHGVIAGVVQPDGSGQVTVAELRRAIADLQPGRDRRPAVGLSTPPETRVPTNERTSS